MCVVVVFFFFFRTNLGRIKQDKVNPNCTVYGSEIAIMTGERLEL